MGSMSLELLALHKRHPGLSKNAAGFYAEAASVVLERHHTSPIDVEVVPSGGASGLRTLSFPSTDQAVKATHANAIDAVENGAYGLSFAAIEVDEHLVAVRRAETRTGADWYVAPVGSAVDDLENCLRLEVSGVEAGGRSIVRARLRSKVKQTQEGISNRPAIASVVGFKERLVMIERVGP